MRCATPQSKHLKLKWHHLIKLLHILKEGCIFRVFNLKQSNNTCIYLPHFPLLSFLFWPIILRAFFYEDGI